MSNEGNLLSCVREEVKSSFTVEELARFKDFKEFFDVVDTQNAYEPEWKPRVYKKYFKVVWDGFKRSGEV